MISNGLYVVTSRDGTRLGAATITWLSQASFRPPLLMAAIRPESSVFACLSRSRVAAVHILGSGQLDVARRFLSPTNAVDGTLNGETIGEGVLEAPILLSAPAYAECRVRRVEDVNGDHVLVVLEVVEAVCRSPIPPLTVADSPWRYGG